MQQHRPFFYAFLFLCFWLFLHLFSAYQANEGHLIYPRDDTYIHMAIAKNFAFHGNWGLEKDAFAASSSSPLYTFLLAIVFCVCGMNEWSPLFWNVIGAALFLFWANRVMWQEEVSAAFRTMSLLGLILLIPLPVLILSGMEHSIQLWIDGVLLWTAVSFLQQPKHAFRLLIFAFLCTAIRYEGMFLIVLVMAMLGWKRKWKMAMGVGVAAALPIVGMGLISIANGAYFFPNSLLVKGNVPSLSEPAKLLYWLQFGLGKFYRYPHVWLLLLLHTGFALHHLRKNSLWQAPHSIMSLVLSLCLILQVFFAEIGSYYRYEAYLVALTLLQLALFLWQLEKKSVWELHSNALVNRLLLLVVVCVGCLPLWIRLAHSSLNYRQATQNIYQQQYRMAHFLAEHAPNASIVANDMGAINFFNDIRVLDLAAIESAEVVEAILAEEFDAAWIDSTAQAQSCEFAMIYDSWFEGLIPANWEKVGEWTIENNVVCGDATVSFYEIEKGALGFMNDD